jgi:D-3-phosphoglycerate dehydrogenase
MKILISDPLAKEGLDILKKVKSFKVDEKPKLPPEELKKIIKDYDAIVIRSGTKLTKDIIENANKMKVIGRAGVGVDNVDVDAASLKGIVVMNAPGGNTISTAEHAFSILLALLRNIPQSNASLRENLWERKKFMGSQAFGKKLGIIGMGRIGTEVAKRAIAFGMKVIAYDPYLSAEKAKELNVEVVTFKKLISQADCITIHTPLTDDTRHLISKDEFKAMKKGVRIVNCARGGIVDEKALADAIKKGIVMGAAMDVYEKSPPVNNPLIGLDCVVATPHLGASTKEAQVNVAIDIAKQVRDALQGKGYTNAVNLPAVDPEILEIVKPYIDLAEKLGKFQGQVIEGSINQVNIKYSGDIAKYTLAPVTMGLVKGLLTPILEEDVNYVNAQVIAKSRGIKIVESKQQEAEDFSSLISIEVVTNKSKSEVAGTMFTKQDPRIVKVNDFYVDAVPAGYMILTKHKDVAGMIGQIGTILGKNKINIAAMAVGRKKKGGEAITVINIDAAVKDKALRGIKSAKNIKDVKLIKL